MNGIGISYLLSKPISGSDLLLLTQLEIQWFEDLLGARQNKLNKVKEELGVCAI